MTADQPPLKRDGRTVHRIEDIARLAGIGVEAAYKLVNRAGLTPVERIGNVYADADVKRALKRPRAGMGGPKKEKAMLTITDQNSGNSATVAYDEIAATLFPWFDGSPSEVDQAIVDLQKAWTPGSSTAHDQDALATYLGVTVRPAE